MLKNKMEKFRKKNKNHLISDDNFVFTKRGFLKLKELKNGDKIIGINKSH